MSPHHGSLAAAVPVNLGLLDAVARHYHRLCGDPDALAELSFEVSLQHLALRDPKLRAQLAESVPCARGRLAELLVGRDSLSPAQAHRLAMALRGLLVGLGRRVG